MLSSSKLPMWISAKSSPWWRQSLKQTARRSSLVMAAMPQTQTKGEAGMRRACFYNRRAVSRTRHRLPAVEASRTHRSGRRLIGLRGRCACIQCAHACRVPAQRAADISAARGGHHSRHALSQVRTRTCSDLDDRWRRDKLLCHVDNQTIDHGGKVAESAEALGC